LLCCETKEVQDIWRKGTRLLKDKRRQLGRPIEREEAIEFFGILRDQAAGKKVPNMKWSKEAPEDMWGKVKKKARPTDGLVDPPTDRFEDIPF
jgi:hypothetical protein